MSIRVPYRIPFCALVLFALVRWSAPASADDASDTALAEATDAGPSARYAAVTTHSGEVMLTEWHHVEIVFYPDEMRLYLYDADQHPLSLAGVTGTVTLRTETGVSGAPAALRFVPEADAISPDYLSAPFRAADFAPRAVKARFALTGVPESESLTLIQTYRRVAPRPEAE